ncbi:MAG TPA: VOC family protein, partial [Devosia sp.]|nr:VOC family protein [Devosia sp.]
MFAPKSTTAMIPAEDIERAKRWYAEALGFRPSKEQGQTGAEYTLPGGLHAFLYATQFAGTAQHTLISF